MRILLLAGEESGVMYAEQIANEICAKNPSAEIRGYGDYGFKTGDLAVMGVGQVLKKIFYFLRVKRTMERAIGEWKPDVVCTVDYPGMNLKLAAYAKKKGIRTVHVVCPQVWAWKKGRIPKIEAALDRLCCFFPFEPELFKPGFAEFVGHPLVDEMREQGTGNREQGTGSREQGTGGKILALLPGSRLGEIEKHLSVLLKVVEKLQVEMPNLKIIIPAANDKAYSKITHVCSLFPISCSLNITHGEAREALRDADAAVVASGTATLEAALAGCPTVLVYRVGWFFAFLARRFIRGVRHIGLANIIAEKAGVPCPMPELLQEDFTEEKVLAALRPLLADPVANAAARQSLADTMKLLKSDGGAIMRIARGLAVCPKLPESGIEPHSSSRERDDSDCSGIAEGMRGRRRFAERLIGIGLFSIVCGADASQDLSVAYDSTAGCFTVVDAESGRTWVSLPGAPCPAGVQVRHRVEGRELVVSLSGDDGKRISSIDFPRPFAAERGDLMLLTQGNGFLFPAEMTDLGTDEIDFSAYPTRNMEMGCFGHFSGTAGYLAIIETPENCGQRYRVWPNGLRQLNVVWRSDRGTFGHERRIRYVFFKNPTPMKMALRYREEMKRKGYYRLFPEKMLERPAMAARYAMLAGAPDVWFWEEDGDKAGFARELKDLGFGTFILQSANRRDLGVWISPEEIRGMAQVPGVLPGVYDIYRDFMDPKNLPLIDCVRPYWPTNVWENGDYVLGPDGSVARGWGVNRKGTAGDKSRIGCALLCEARSWPYARANLTRDLKAAPHAVRMFDVVGGSLGECYNPLHPLSERASRIARQEFFANAEGEFGILAGTEDGSECFVNCCSYFEGTMSAPNHYRVDGGRYMWRLYDEVPDKIRRGTDPATRVPFFDMVFHGCVNLYWYWCDYNNKFPSLWHRRDLFNFVTGEPPMYFFTRETFARQKSRLAASYDVATRVAKETFGVPMSDYRWLSADRMVQQSVFENGVVATVNFGDKPFVMEDGFALSPGGCRFEKRR